MRMPSLLLICLLLLVSCLKDSTGTHEMATPKVTNFFPLKIGNQWTYKVTPNHDPENESIEIWTVVDQVTVDGRKYYWLSVEGEWHEDMLLQLEDDGLSIVAYDSALDTVLDGLFIKYPVDDGEVYEYQDSLRAMPDYYDGWITMQATRTQMMYDSITYDAYGYAWLDLLIDIPIYYFVPGVGIIESNTFYVTQRGAVAELYFRRELISHVIK